MNLPLDDQVFMDRYRATEARERMNQRWRDAAARVSRSINARCDAESKRAAREAQTHRRWLGQLFRRDRLP